ncbi:MAG: Nif3-like dinuclear metal center hexameric protein [Caulobacteraceae bacterium]
MPDTPPPPPPRPPAHTGPITALQFIDRVLEKTGAPGRTATVDRVIAGDPTLAVTGIATTGMATLDVLRAAAAAGHNLIITYEPVFWSSNEDLDRLEGDPLFLQKRDFIRANRLVCFTLHDHWRDRTPDGVVAGMADELGWTSDADGPDRFRLAPTTLAALAQSLSQALHDPSLRVVGDPGLAVRTVATSFGNASQIPTIHLLNGPEDVVVVGYTHEWEAVEYAQDMVATGARKGLVLLGELASVQGGMKYCAQWVKGFTPEVPVAFFPAQDPYWTLES